MYLIMAVEGDDAGPNFAVLELTPIMLDKINRIRGLLEDCRRIDRAYAIEAGCPEVEWYRLQARPYLPLSHPLWTIISRSGIAIEIFTEDAIPADKVGWVQHGSDVERDYPGLSRFHAHERHMKVSIFFKSVMFSAITNVGAHKVQTRFVPLNKILGERVPLKIDWSALTGNHPEMPGDANKAPGEGG